MRVAYGESGVSLPELATDETSAAPLVSFAGAVQRIAHSLSTPPAPTEGVVIVLGAGSVGERSRLVEELTGVIAAPSLASVRWAIIERGAATLVPVVNSMGPAALSLTCRIDRDRQRTETDGLLDALAGAPGDAIRPARVGGAGPDVAPPPRRGEPRLPAPTQPSPIPPFIGGVKALRRGELEQAVALQRDAHARRVAAGDLSGALEMEILLAVYQGQLALASRSSVRPALATFEAAIERATGAALPAVAARAAFLAGVLTSAGGDAPAAVLALQRASTLAEVAGSHPLQAEALRFAADLVARNGLPDRAAQLRAAATRAAARGEAPAPPAGEAS